MRGSDGRSGALFGHVDLEDRVATAHPRRAIRSIVDEALAGLSSDFAGLYAQDGRPSIPPKRLLRALLLQAFHAIRSERQLMEQLDFNLLWRWFAGLGIDDPVWDPTTFCKNRDRLLDGDVARRFLEQVLDHARARGLLSNDHFSVDGTLIEAWASMKSFRPRDASENDGGPPPAGRLDGRTTRHAGHAASQRHRKRIEEICGWIKTVGGLRKTRHRGTALVGWMFTLTVAAYNVVRIPKLVAATG